MHSHALATGKALCRLIDSPPENLAVEISAFAELARVRLHLDNSALTAAVMFAQPLVDNVETRVEVCVYCRTVARGQIYG